MLVPRCPLHPAYDGTTKPGEHPDVLSQSAAGSSTCADCWELFRREHEHKGVRHL